MNIAIGSDHAGYPLKQQLIAYLDAQNLQYDDCGTHSLASCDYPDYAHSVAEMVESGAAEFGILLCGSGQGVAITANKHRSIRAALCWSAEIAGLSRAHNDANVLCLPARFVSETEAQNIVDAFLTTVFEGGRHQLRVAKI
jgi:ribose 5-phosphate isomerase B